MDKTVSPIRFGTITQGLPNKPQEPEIRYTTLSSVCKDWHRFFALEELISNESTKTSLIVLACTQCGSLIIHKVQAQ